MSTAYQRGMVWLSQRRYDLAEREFRRALVEDPNAPLGHAWVSFCLVHRPDDREAWAEALREADEAVRLGPALPFCQQARAEALIQNGRLSDAEAAAREALRLGPLDAGHWGLLASVAMGRRRWPEVLEAAERGLALDPSHAVCRNLHAMALVQLGRADEATAALGSALADDPENALTHANQGWALLRDGEHERAIVHFREALRIHPGLDWAHFGMIEAVGSRGLIGREMHRFSHWMVRRGAIAVGAMGLGLVLGREALAWLAPADPSHAQLLVLFRALMGWILFVWWQYAAIRCVSSVLWLNFFRRPSLSPARRLGAIVLAVALLLLSGFLTIVVIGASGPFVYMYSGLLVMPLFIWYVRARGPSFALLVFRTTCGPLGPGRHRKLR